MMGRSGTRVVHTVLLYVMVAQVAPGREITTFFVFVFNFKIYMSPVRDWVSARGIILPG
jgi:hypothetical protein